ncbi:MAG TPA: hypothetical protein VFY27_07705 [Woeseiaceae bacterium]|nr:hypothetical protein [Woeseiaceae bacterium]
MLQSQCDIGKGVPAKAARKIAVVALCLTAGAAASWAGKASPVPPGAALPEKLSQTGLFLPGTTDVAADLLPFAPQYPLWTDGATKRRWLHLPPGTSIDAAKPDAWVFPAGTRVWKEFGYDGPVETRMIERLADGSWRYATYIWNEDGSDAELAPTEGVPALPVSGAPDGIYSIPSENDCRGCHEAAAQPVLGFSALQLSPDRDPLAPHAERPDRAYVDLRVLHERGLLLQLPEELVKTPPRIAAPSPQARAALGYLHGNCGHCHNDTGPIAELDLSLRQSAVARSASAARTLESLVGYPAEVSTKKIDTRVVPGSHESSMLFARMRTRNPLMQMPPLGTRVSDATAVALIGSWIEQDLSNPSETLARGHHQ